MYTLKVPYKNFHDQPKNAEVQFNLTIPETFKLLVEFQAIFAWIESIKGEEIRELPTEDVLAFYNNLETILLEAYGESSNDGEYFRKNGRYDFADSAKFPAVMVMFVSDPEEAMRLVDGLMPKDIQELVEKADANMAKLAQNPENTAEFQSELERLRAEVAEMRAAVPSTPPPVAGP